MKDVLSMLKGMDQAELAAAVNKARAFVNTPEGKELVNRLKNGGAVEGLSVTDEERERISARIANDPELMKRLLKN